MWDALRRGGTPSDNGQQCAIPSPAEDSGPILADAEEIPYIEVGPRKSMEASPSVLACSPDVVAPSLTLFSRENPSVRDCHKPATELRSVPFRTVFLATPETEPETPRIETLSRLIDFL